jgi:hypothetical protein
VVVWRRQRGATGRTGGEHQFYTREQREPSNPAIRNIVNGMDVRALVGAIKLDPIEMDRRWNRGQAPVKTDDEMRRATEGLPGTPDERLR